MHCQILSGVLLAVTGVSIVGCQPLDPRDSTPHSRATTPVAFRARGQLVCLAEEMKRVHKAAVQPVHDHVVGFRIDEELRVGKARYLTILRTQQSKALFVDKRFQRRDLVLIGRTFPETAILEVSGWRWFKGGKLFDVHYWCEVCSIRSLDPGSCACCQGGVELREEPEKTRRKAPPED